MPIHNPYWVYLSNLAGRFDKERLDYLPREKARRRLVEVAGQDFGYDVDAWTRWLIDAGYLRASPAAVWPPPADGSPTPTAGEATVWLTSLDPSSTGPA